MCGVERARGILAAASLSPASAAPPAPPAPSQWGCVRYGLCAGRDQGVRLSELVDRPGAGYGIRHLRDVVQKLITGLVGVFLDVMFPCLALPRWAGERGA